jgi:hypothetical protein
VHRGGGAVHGANYVDGDTQVQTRYPGVSIYQPALLGNLAAQAALDHDAKAKTFFETLNGANRYAVLWRVQTAKRAETRAKRIAKFVAMLARHDCIPDIGRRLISGES